MIFFKIITVTFFFWASRPLVLRNYLWTVEVYDELLLQPLHHQVDGRGDCHLIMEEFPPIA